MSITAFCPSCNREMVWYEGRTCHYCQIKIQKPGAPKLSPEQKFHFGQKLQESILARSEAWKRGEKMPRHYRYKTRPKKADLILRVAEFDHLQDTLIAQDARIAKLEEAIKQLETQLSQLLTINT